MEVKLHDIGEGMTEADINCFLVKAGDFVRADEPIIEIQTDKMTAEIPAPRTGYIREFKVEIGQTVPVGTTLLILEEEGSLNKQPISPATMTVDHSMTNVKDYKKRILASPYTRKIARENGINIEVVKGSGPAGRITDEDIYQLMASSQQQDSERNSQPTRNTTIAPAELPPLKSDTIPFRGRRKQIAKKMVQSLNTIPHCTHFEEVDVTELIQFRAELKNINQTITATAFFIKALSVCLTEFPIFNARLDEENEVIHLLKEHHIGMAVDAEDGLIVPVLRHVEKKSIRAIHDEMKIVTEKALANKLSMKDITGGTFTISNVGPLGGSFGATPIIQHPEVALVSFHKTKKMPVVTEDDQIVIRSIMNISMSFDHRVADGASAVRFTNRFAQFIQNPKMLLLELV
ncbi:dihydrolipoamide acetyltransferase family protein [Bacillus sp. DTU_2020_1000418_1_SI_GHA_SEK_038]|uniref:dihydrolipoamide acetyltransferase family protein n=1 Tax=Bacillus sp. DTU_2020_1000418_1_SI_GHA_SEK_038 TaxID=3077585 RepID=UPI0028E50BC2|nr:dihydrolipoamide acetyltransferase family protein [Bacillus sp. DTU_2020_1000418_1_SI_GHA_SEK_038]WNS77311.1 dihydrolipoamide acetyltransferase family protein [Bacillus sp. DTU_2020_1000418_1_SI_GHA_SEK_038]